MRFNLLKSSLKTAVLATTILLLGASLAVAQVNLTASRTNTTLPDGKLVPMWGYSCGTATGATCAALNPNAGTAAVITPATPGWSPVVITVPTGSALQIILTNNLSVPTSLTIVGQLGGGLGAPTSVPSPVHPDQVATWPVGGTNPPALGDPVNHPPAQSDRVRSFGTEVAANGGIQSLTWNSLRPGTYLLESGSHPSIQGAMGLYGILVVTTAPTVTTTAPVTETAAGCAYSNAAGTCVIPYDAEVPLVFSEIDPWQNTEVDTAVASTGFSESTVWTGGPSGCGAAHTCYPPTVNYSPFYYLINGVAFDQTSSTKSLFPVNPSTLAPASGAGSVLVRMVNAGLRMHVPSMVGMLTTPPIVTAGTTAAAVSGFSLIAEDGNPLPGVSRVQNEVFLAAGKTYDVMINPPTGTAAIPVYDRQLSLSANATARNTGMLAYIGVAGSQLPSVPSLGAAVARADTYNSLVAGQTLTVSDASKGLLANDSNVFGAQLLTQAANGTVILEANGTFQYTPTGTATTDSFSYCANGTVIPPASGTCSSGITATVTLGAQADLGGVTVKDDSWTSNVATTLSIKSPGVLGNDSDASGYPLTVNAASVATTPGLTVSVDKSGAFNASVTTPGTYTFSYKAQNSLGTISATAATVMLTFPTPTGLLVTLQDGIDKSVTVSDYRWIIEEDRTFFIDPNCQTNPLPATCPKATPQLTPAIFGTNFHASYMPVVAQGCTGTKSCESGQTLLGVSAVCDGNNGVCRPGSQKTPVDPASVYLDPTKHYYISVLPGDAVDPGHAMGGAQIGPGQTAVTVIVEPELQPPSKVSVFVFEDDHPLNGEHDASGGIDTLSPNEPGLGGFNITILDLVGGSGDPAGQMTYDEFGQPLGNALAGTPDPANGGIDACPISKDPSPGFDGVKSQTGITGVIPVCPQYESNGTTLSPLAGQAVVAKMPPGRYGIVATPAADRIARGEEWLQTNTLDGGKDHEAFIKVNEPAYFQEFGPAGYHVSIGFANPKFINQIASNSKKTGLCDPVSNNPAIPGGGGLSCNQTVTGKITGARMSRTPDQRLYGSGTHDIYGYTQCYVSLGSPDGADFAFTKCNDDGSFALKGVPTGDWRITIFDQWNDQIVDGISTPVHSGILASVTNGGTGYSVAVPPTVTVSAPNCTPTPTSTTCIQAVAVANVNSAGVVTGITFTNEGAGYTTSPVVTIAAPSSGVTAVASARISSDMGEIGVHGWKDNLYTRSFFDLNGNGVSDVDAQGNPTEPGLPLVATNIRYRDGSYSNFNSTDLDGFAGFNEIFPIFNWYVMETDSTRYKTTGIHVINDAGGPVDASANSTSPYRCGQGGYPACGNSASMGTMARTAEDFPLPNNLRVPGAYYCSNADCSGATDTIANGPGGPGGSTGRIDPPWVTSYGWQSFMGQNQLIEFGKKPFAEGENGGIRGHVVYASTRPFDDPALLLQLSWEPLVPHVRINLYKKGFAADGVTETLTLVDYTDTTSFDDWAQGFRTDGVPNMNCPGQSTSDPFYYTLFQQPNLLDFYQSQHTGGTPVTPLPNGSQYKCYDGMHNWNQLQPAPYDGMYSFPSVTSINPTTGKPAGTNCTGCTTDPDATDPYRSGQPMLPAGKYVVEMITPPGYELVKEEDKNILLGDTFEGPVTTQFAGFGNIFIVPDQASVASSYNPNNPLISATNFGQPRHEGDTGSVEVFWPCVGESRIVPDFMSLFPQSGQNAPFAGATRNLCDRKEVTLEDQMAVLAKFYVFTSTHVAAHYTGIISDDFAGEFDPFAPAFGEKFSPPNLPVGIHDWAGNEIGRVMSDNHGEYNGLTYSTFAVNPPDPSGYIPNMLDMCMNDRGTGTTPDPFYQANYSQFCYVWSFMPGQTGYLDTPVIPTSAFAAEYNHPDCEYPEFTPAIKEVDGDGGPGSGPWVSAASKQLTITSLGIQQVNNYGYSGPSAAAPFNTKTVPRNFGFGDTKGTVSIGGVAVDPSTITWTDSTITLPVPAGVPDCAIQQQLQYRKTGAPITNAQCGELSITAANGKKSVDTVTVTIGGNPPTPMAVGSKIQDAIDAARPGDLIMIPPGTYHELVVMWKPVRLQGVGAASVIIDANTHPSGQLLNPWRTKIVCLFGLGPDGRHQSWDQTCGSSWSDWAATTSNPQVDRLPLEATVGWDASLNGNLAEQLQEPSLMGAYEGAGITVLSKGVRFPNTDSEFLADTFPAGTALLTKGAGRNNCGPDDGTSPNRYPSSFQCNPSRIDGLSVTNSSQGGGGIFVHGWAHNLEIANNRVYNNQGTLAGGISIGQGEHPSAYVAGGISEVPGSCLPGNGLPPNTQLPYCFDQFVNVHHNYVSKNSSEGDELFSASPTGAGGVAFCSGADNYKFNYNWVCGNLSTGDGAGVTQAGFVWNAEIQHNTILFNQATNPTTPSNGGGLLIMSAPDTDPLCPGEPDVDCAHAFGSVGDGVGPNLVINANLIMGNAAEAGAGGGVRFQGVNGVEVSTFPTNPGLWYTVKFTNNIVANNVAGWDGGGISLQDSIGVNLINNTIISNDSTASSGTLFGAFFASQASAPTPCPRDANGANINCVPLTAPQPAGISSAEHTSEFEKSLPGTITCPTGHGAGGTGQGGLDNGACRTVSVPMIYNDILWQNRAFNVVVTQPTGGVNQATVTLTPSVNQGSTGQCVSLPTTSYWDLGLRGDSGPTDHGSGFTFSPQASVLTSVAGYTGGGNGFRVNTASDPSVKQQYCNGSKRPPEAVCKDNNTGATIPCGYSVPPGTNETNVPNPVFNLTAGATVDEGNNWVSISWGPLAMTNPKTGAQLSDYSLADTSPVINYVTSANSFATYLAAPSNDFFETPRKTNGAVDVGAVESLFMPPPPTLASISPASGVIGTAVPVTLTGTNLTNASAITVSGAGVTASNLVVVNGTTVTATFTIAVNAQLTARNVSITTPGGTSGTVAFTVTAPRLTSIAPVSGVRGSAVPVTLTGSGLTGTTAVTVSGTNVTVSNVVVVNDTTVTATFTIGNTASLFPRNVTITTVPGVTTNAVTFTVTVPAGPSLTSIAPNSGFRGNRVVVVLTGSGFTGATGINITGGFGVNVSGFTVVNDTTISATFAISPNAFLGSRNIAVTKPGNVISNSMPFAITNPPVATVTSVTPNAGTHGTSVAVTISGTNFTTNGTTLRGVAGLNATNVTVVNSTTITATFTITNGAPRTTRQIGVTTPAGLSNTAPFTVN